MHYSMAYSPCPNDTFMFHDLAMGRLAPPDGSIDTHLHDVETLNQLALRGTYDVTKVSFHTYLLIQDRYELLEAGAALGLDCGPVVVAPRDLQPADLDGRRVAVPGELTTAHLLLRLWAPQVTERVFVRYDQIMDRVVAGEVDAGVLIHEGRFVYPQAGLHLVADLGEWWRQQTGLPIPLGCIVARRSLGNETVRALEGLVKQAVTNSMADPEATFAYVRQHAQEMDEAVLRAHIRTFVNEYSLDLGDDGRAAVAALKRLAEDAGIVG